MIKIAICGSAKNELPKEILAKAKIIGQTLAQNKITVFSGATTGYTHEALKSALKNGALTIGISPAENFEEHTQIYKLSTDAYKIIIFTGLGYKARDIVLIRSIDAVIFIGGGVGTIVELCAAIDNQKIIGVLSGSGGATEIFDQIAKVSHRHQPKFIYEQDPQILVKKVIKSVRERKNL